MQFKVMETVRENRGKVALKNGQFRGDGYAIREMHANVGRLAGLIPSVFLLTVTLPHESSYRSIDRSVT